MKGEQIKTMQEVFDAADRKKALWFEKWKRHVPAAILQCAGARSLQEWIDSGMVWTYIARERRAP
jgi:hypothetical protein